ncbi:phosphatase PAP2 family protein [Luteimonas vadosa]|uniref:Phosphatase PAP2 family protein n=1 Tax=Luteimonas vadosa TaxID=1165507 RepID=A0ABP9DZ22_9GAMM
MSQGLARAASIAGHPLPVLSLTLLALARHEGADPSGLVGIGAGLAVFAAVVLGYSWWRVRQGHWRHVDASQAAERQHLNRFLLGLLLAAAAVAALAGLPLLALRLALAGLLVLVALLLARWCKPSLHLAFAVYAAALLAIAWPAAAITMLAFAAVLAWSRLRLARHAPRDLVAGFWAGALAGVLARMVPLLPGWQG